jgi:hypothetical protein
LPDASAREKWILVTMAIVTIWMGIGSTFITARTAAAAQDVIDQVEPQRAYEASVPNGTSPSRVAPQAKHDSANAAAKIIPTERLGIR